MILVTGSEGFIGRNLVRKLYSENNDIFEFDAKHFEPMKLFDVMDLSKITRIYHLGAISSTVEQDIDKLYEYNVKFSIRLFEEAIQRKIPVLYTSSASVFGNTMKNDEYRYNPLNYYASTKHMVEMWINDHMREFSQINVMRLYNVYGEDENKSDMSQSPVYKFTQQAKTQGHITLFKDSHLALRDFVCVEDVLTAFDCHINKVRNSVNDIGTGNPISFLEVGQLVAEIYDVPIKFVHMPNYMVNKYQWYTKARPGLPFMCQSVKDWLKYH